jgi:hypothetical protein
MSLKKKEILNPCDICTKEVTNNYTVTCPFCNVEICESCFQYSITMDLKTPYCVYCKKTLSLEFVLGNNETKWCREIFIPFFENLCLEKEKNYLIDTMPKYKKMVEIRNLNKQIKNLPSNKKIETELMKDFNSKKDKHFMNLLNDKLDEKNIQKEILNKQIYLLEDNKKTSDKKENKTTYISNCPNSKCRGFITNKYTCEICHLEICKACMSKKEEGHSCKRDDIESAQLIRESSKPCPKCYIPIFKISGCNQMFCTNCHVVFDWVTLKIDNGSVHNVHYFDWMTNQNNSENIDLDEVACGDIINIYINLSHQVYLNYDDNDYYKFQKIKRMFEVNRIFHGEIIENIREELIRNRFEDFRIEYLDNKISENKWKSKIARDTINNEKYRSLIEIFEMYVTITSDLIRQLAFKKLTVSKLLESYTEFFRYFEKTIDETLEIFGGNLTSRQDGIIVLAKKL